jgi:hypothetical protein
VSSLSEAKPNPLVLALAAAVWGTVRNVGTLEDALFSTRDTVLGATPAAAAMSRIRLTGRAGGRIGAASADC